MSALVLCRFLFGAGGVAFWNQAAGIQPCRIAGIDPCRNSHGKRLLVGLTSAVLDFFTISFPGSLWESFRELGVASLEGKVKALKGLQETDDCDLERVVSAGIFSQGAVNGPPGCCWKVGGVSFICRAIGEREPLSWQDNVPRWSKTNGK